MHIRSHFLTQKRKYVPEAPKLKTEINVDTFFIFTEDSIDEYSVKHYIAFLNKYWYQIGGT